MAQDVSAKSVRGEGSLILTAGGGEGSLSETLEISEPGGLEAELEAVQFETKEASGRLAEVSGMWAKAGVREWEEAEQWKEMAGERPCFSSRGEITIVGHVAKGRDKYRNKGRTRRQHEGRTRNQNKSHEETKQKPREDTRQALGTWGGLAREKRKASIKHSRTWPGGKRHGWVRARRARGHKQGR